MKKLSVLLLLLAGLAAAGLVPLRRWQAQTAEQAAQIQAQRDRTAAFLQTDPTLWTNEAAEAALAPKAAEERDDDCVARFVSPEGIQFISQSEAWDAEKLQALYEELLRNRHGEELRSLTQVTVLPDENEDFTGYQNDVALSYTFSPRFPLFPEGEACAFDLKGSLIVLTRGDERTTVESQAETLSHEYGHHYTKSYLLLSYGHAADLNRPYALTRGLNSDNTYVYVQDTETYKDNHHRTLVEIAAEDYVVLMGSPNAMKEIGDYYDLRERVAGKRNTEVACRNLLPQENLFLPFATKVPGLADLFYAPLGEAAPTYPQTGDIGLRFERQEETFSLTTGHYTSVSYKLTWDKTLGEDATYTLVCLDPETEQVYPVKTVRPGAPAEAEIGEVAISEGNTVTFYSDELAEGVRRFLVVVTTPEGKVAVSDPVERTF